MKAIYKRELSSYFNSMIGYVFIAFMVVAVGIYFMAINLFNGYPGFSYTLYNAMLICLIAIPILTMRSMPEDRHNKTDQLLLTAPVSITEMVLGKYLAMLTVYAIPTILFCICPLIIKANGTAQLLTDYNSILVFFILGAVYIAIGLFISSLTESQIISAVGTFFILLTLSLWGDLVEFIPTSSFASLIGFFVVLVIIAAIVHSFNGNVKISGGIAIIGTVALIIGYIAKKDAFRTLLQDVLRSFSVSEVFHNVSVYNVFDVKGVLLYFSLIVLLVFLTVQVIQKRRWGANSKIGNYSTGLIAAVLAVVVVFNLFIGQLPSGLSEIDLSNQKLYTVSDISREYLGNLDKDVVLTVYAQKEAIDSRIQKFLDNYEAISSHVSIEYVDPVQYPSALKEAETTQDTIVVSCEATGKEDIVDFSEIILYSTNYMYVSTESAFDADGQITGAIDYVVREETKKAYAISGHKETALSDDVNNMMERSRITVEDINLLTNNGIPEDCNLLICNAPTVDFANDELTQIRTYLENGGQMMLLLSADATDMNNLTALMNIYGLNPLNGYVADLKRYYQNNAYAFFPTLNTSNEITQEFTKDSIVLVYNTTGTEEITPERDTITTESFLTTSESGVLVENGEEIKGVYTIGATATEAVTNEAGEEVTARLTVISASSLIDEEITKSFSNVENLNIFVNAVTVGFTDISNISIPPKSLEITYNTIENSGFLSLIYLAFIPLLILIGGFIRWFHRRKL